MRSLLALSLLCSILACGDDATPSDAAGVDGGGIDGGGDERGSWVTVNEPVAVFPESAIHEEHLIHDGALFIRYRDMSSERLIRYDNGPFTMVSGEVSPFGSDLFVFDGELHMSYLQTIGAGMSRVGMARLRDGAFEVVEPNVIEIGAAGVPRAFVQGGDAWLLFRSQTRGAFTDAIRLVRYDGESFEPLAEIATDPGFDTSVVVMEDGDAIYVAFGSTGLPSGDYADPYRIHELEAGMLVERTTLRTSTSFIRDEPIAWGGGIFLTERNPDGSDAIVRYALDGTRRVIASSMSTHVFGPVRASNLGPAWVKYYVGSVDNRYSRNQYYDADRDAVVDLPYRWPDGVSEPGGTDAEDFLFGAFDLGVEIIVPFELDGAVHMIANVVDGVGSAGNPYAMYLMRYDER